MCQAIDTLKTQNRMMWYTLCELVTCIVNVVSCYVLVKILCVKEISGWWCITKFTKLGTKLR